MRSVSVPHLIDPHNNPTASLSLGRSRKKHPQLGSVLRQRCRTLLCPPPPHFFLFSGRLSVCFSWEWAPAVETWRTNPFSPQNFADEMKSPACYKTAVKRENAFNAHSCTFCTSWQLFSAQKRLFVTICTFCTLGVGAPGLRLLDPQGLWFVQISAQLALCTQVQCKEWIKRALHIRGSRFRAFRELNSARETSKVDFISALLRANSSKRT